MKAIIFVTLLSLTVSFVCGQNLQRCSGDTDCNGPNMKCSDSKDCVCKPGYRNDSPNVCFSVLGSNCDRNDECSNFKGAVCENNRCTCKSGTEAGSFECLNAATIGERCAFASQCIERAGAFAECKSNICKCQPGYHAAVTSDLCILNKDLTQMCTNENECYKEVNGENAAECVAGKCQCKSGYKQVEDTCDGCSTKFILSMASLLFIACTLLKF